MYLFIKLNILKCCSMFYKKYIEEGKLIYEENIIFVV